MPAAKKDKHKGELQKFVNAWKSLGAPEGENGPEQALRVILARNGTRDGSGKGIAVLWDRYVDINEVRIADPKELGGLMGPFVKNDPVDVAHHLRGFLREYYKHRNTLDFGEWRTHTPEQLRKYLDGTEWFRREIGLAIFLQLLLEETSRDDETEEPAEGESKPRKRTDREATLALDRMRMACAFAAYGESPSKAKLSVAHRKVNDAFKFGPVPELPPPPPPPTIPTIVVPPAGSSKVALKVVKSPAKKAAKKAAKKTAAKKVAKKAAKKAAKKVAKKKAAKKVAKKAAKKVAKKKAAKKAAKKVAKKTSASRAGGGARPRTTRATRSPSKSKKSSRR